MNAAPLRLLLADDDKDDCFLFEDALREIPIPTNLITAPDGEKLMRILTEGKTKVPDVVFLDLNMPLKNGFQCLVEIKHNALLKELPVVIFSTFFQDQAIEMLYKNGAHHCMRKPVEFYSLKKMVHCVLSLIVKEQNTQPPRENFVISDN
jgi:response regulator RpfG family c-di-GMP phosphodiesterase